MRERSSDDRPPVFVISVAAQLAGMHPQTLRQYDRLGPGVAGPGRRRRPPLLRARRRAAARGAAALAGGGRQPRRHQADHRARAPGRRAARAGRRAGRTRLDARRVDERSRRPRGRRCAPRTAGDLVRVDTTSRRSSCWTGGQSDMDADQELTTQARRRRSTAPCPATPPPTGNPQVEPAHLLLALLAQADGIAVAAARRRGREPAIVDGRAPTRLLRRAADGVRRHGRRAARCRRAVAHGARRRAGREAQAAAATSTSPPSTCWSALARGAAATSATLLRRRRRDARTRCSRRFEQVRGGQRVTSADPEGTYQALEKYGVDLTAARPRRQARPGHRPGRRDPPGGAGAVPADQEQPGPDRRARRRQDRHRRGAGAADRRRRRAGVAARTSGWSRSTSARWSPARSTAASSRSGSRPCSTRSRQSDGQVVTFIDELHTVVGAGADRGVAMDAGNMLKPMLARGELRMVGATTLDEYREHIEKDPALERRFQQVLVGEPIGRGHHRDPARAQGALRGAPQGADHRRRAGRGGDAVRPLHHRALPARQGDRPRRRGGVPAAHGDRLPAGRDRRAAARRRPAARWRRWRWRKETDDASQERLAQAARATSPTARSSWPR